MATLSKSHLLASKQCHRRLWLEIHQPKLRDNSKRTESYLGAGTKAGIVARKVYDVKQTGTTLNIGAEGFDAVLKRTAKLLAEPKPIFEGGFQAKGIVAFADILLPMKKRTGLAWRMVEVKSSASVKDYHRQDASIQAFVARSAGVPLASIAIAHINTDFTYRGDEKYRGLFVEEDVSKEAFGRAKEVQEWITEASEIAARRDEPVVSTGDHCSEPFECGFLKYCRSKEKQPKHSADVLPGRWSKALVEYITKNAIVELKDVPDNLLSAQQLRVKAHTLSNTTFFDAKGAAGALRGARLPAYFLDFETIAFTVPIWKDTRPFQPIPFQFSLHHLSKAGALKHRFFIDLSGRDPRHAFTDALLAECGNSGPIFVFNASFEKSRVNDLAALFPREKRVLHAIRDRMIDIQPIVKKHYYHPSQKGRWSIKAVLPAIVPDLNYQELEGVQDGSAAMIAFAEATDPTTLAARKQKIEQDLLKYCELDTYALVRVWHHLSSTGLKIKRVA